ncbi:hypothetical protein ACQPXM_11870 [Kribbella sp. CA-253562]|uniref:hypothetical protein n=1 Tax=Kribbella sp. CA-253562 TaxID=3239942 RepID=UPI003D8A5288
MDDTTGSGVAEDLIHPPHPRRHSAGRHQPWARGCPTTAAVPTESTISPSGPPRAIAIGQAKQRAGSSTSVQMPIVTRKFDGTFFQLE